MVASWEIKAARQVLVGILHVDQVTIAWSLGLRNLVIPGEILPTCGQPYDMARNTLCKATVEGGFEWLFCLDSDVVPPKDTILRLMAHRQPIVSGVYCRRSPPQSIPVMLKTINGQRQWLQRIPDRGLMEVELVGAGCLLIHRSVLENLPPQRPGYHWFDWRVNMRGLMPDEECLSEDFTFCVHAQKHGYKILVDTSIRCKHIGLAEADHGTFLPCEVRTHT